jgi:chemotaxis protein MotB
MMALFIVLWLLNQSPKIQQAVGGYFRDPNGTADKAGKSIVGAAATTIAPQENMEHLKSELEKTISHVPNFDKLKSHIVMTVTPEGLRIDLIEGEKGTFFDSGSSKLSGDGQDILVSLAQELGKLPNNLSVEGHTDAKPYAKASNYGNWELSADRANSARRLIQANGVREDQVTQVRGFGDQKLLHPDAPLDPANRRISLIVQYVEGHDLPKIETPGANVKPPSSVSIPPTHPPTKD